MTVKQVRELILMLRKERIAYTTLKVGGVELDGVTDLKLAESRQPMKSEPRLSAWERYGGPLLEQPSTAVDTTPDEAKVDW